MPSFTCNGTAKVWYSIPNIISTFNSSLITPFFIGILHLAPTALPIILQNSQTAAIVLHSIKNNIDNEMPMLLFHWNDLGFNDVPTSPNLRNEVIGQLQQAIVANLIANRAIDYRNHGLLFIFPNDTTIGTWARNVSANISPL
ncbi:unnamed protein product [Rhizophagus irregularis]|nr:unnamed protein product [Rhizophagus irregularis]